MHCFTEYLKTCFHKVLCSEHGDEDSRRFTEVTLSEIRSDRDTKWSDSRNAIAPSQIEQLASFLEQVW